MIQPFQQAFMYSKLSCRLLLIFSLLSGEANSQHLFGNPNCENWPTLSVSEKTTWLNAFLVPLNLTNVSRKKPKVDKFSQLTSLDPAVKYVDSYCEANADKLAAVAAIKFLDELTLEH